MRQECRFSIAERVKTTSGYDNCLKLYEKLDDRRYTTIAPFGQEAIILDAGATYSPTRIASLRYKLLFTTFSYLGNSVFWVSEEYVLPFENRIV